MGEAIVRHTGVDKIAFTGSTEVGRLIRQATAGSGKKLSLELGGKSPFVVFDSADLDSVVEGVVDAIWFNQGQVCCAGSRLLVQESVAPRLLAKLRARMEKLRVGDPLDKAVDIGAIIAPAQLRKIERLVKQGAAEGATLWQPSWACPKEGYFYPPTLLTDVAPASTVAQVEIFGPVLVSMTFRTPAEAVALANNTRFGLAASVWSEDINLALDVARQVKAGVVWVNSTNLFDAASGFGGYRESGFGREGGREGLFEYVRRAEAPRVEARAPRRGLGAASPPAPRPTAFRRSTGRPSCSSAASRRARTPATAARCSARAAAWWARWARATGRTSATRSRRPARPRAGANQTAHNRAQVLYYIGENLAAPRGGDGRAPRADDRGRGGREGRGRSHDRAALLLRGLGRQVRRRRPPHAAAQRHAGHARGRRHDRHRVPGRGARSWPSSRWWPPPSPWATP